MTKLRDYQSEAIDAVESDWQAGHQRVGVSMATGMGKTVIMSHMALRRRDDRVLFLLHRDTLVEQTTRKLWELDSKMDVGIVKAARNEVDRDVVVASVHTLKRAARREQLGRFGTVIVDEAHVSASDTYRTVLDDLGAFLPWGPKVAGFSATWSRSDNRGLGDIWQKISYAKGIKWAIKHGFLVMPEAKAVVTDLDLRGVSTAGGDYSEQELGIRMTDDSILNAIIAAYREHAGGRRGVLFAPTVDSAEYFAAGLTRAGFVTEGVYGITPATERAGIYDRYRAGVTQILTSCTALAEGWDAPWCEVAVLARPTLHAGLFVQQVGRVLRPWPGKSSALVLDVVGATKSHSLHALIELEETVVREPGEERDQLDEEEERQAASKWDAKVQGFADVDLFAGTEARWLRTDAGTLFVRTSENIIFLYADGETWRVGKCPKNSTNGGRWLADGLTAEDALTQASDLAIDEDPSIVSTKSAWRQGKRAPSEKQVAFAIQLNIDPQGLTKATISDAINVKLASRVLDRRSQ